MKLTHKILKLVIENKDRAFTIREISKILKTDYKNTYDAVQSIKESLKTDKKGNATYISFLPLLTNDIYEVEQIRKDQIRKNIELIYNDIHTIDNPFFIGVLFGSYAKNKQTRQSDIDICIIHDNEKESKKIAVKLAIHPKIELHLFSYQQFLQLIRSKEFNVGNEIVKQGIILKNIEAYYEVIKHG
jgi:DNA polymerase sigma